MRKAIAIGVFALLFGVGAFAQSTASSVPDELIFRVWLNNMTSNGNIKPTVNIGLSPADNALLRKAMQSYEVSYQALIARNPKMDWPALLSITHNTFTALQTSMTTAAFDKFDAYLQTLKRQARISPHDPAFGESAKLLGKEDHMMAGMPQTGGMSPDYSSIDTTVLAGGRLMDDFSTDAAGAPNGNWVTAQGSFAVSSTGTLSVTTQGTDSIAAMYYSDQGTITTYQGQCSGTTIGTVPTGILGSYPGGAIRMNTAGNTFYTAFYISGQIAFWKYVDGAFSWVMPGGTYEYDAQAGDYIGICGEGSALTVYLINAAGTVAGQIMSTTDTTIASGYPGIYGQVTPTGIHYPNDHAGTATFWDGLTQDQWYVTIGVSGDATCALGCPAGATHHATVTNTNGTLGVTGYESSDVLPTSYIDQYYDQIYPNDELLGGVIPPITIADEIICSIIGNFYGTGGTIGKQLELAITFAKNQGILEPPFGDEVTVMCTTATTTPDYNPYAVFGIGAYPPLTDAYFKALAACVGAVFNGPTYEWSCTQIAYHPYTSAQAMTQWQLHGTTNPDGYNCTKFPNYKGLPYP